MSTLGWIAVIAFAVFALVVLVLGWAVFWVVRALRDLSTGVSELGGELDQLRRQTLPLLADTRAALRRSEGATVKTDALVKTAESLTGTVDSASKLAYRVLSNPLVKVLAFFTGTRRAAGRLREITDPAGTAQGRFARARRATQRANQSTRAIGAGPGAGRRVDRADQGRAGGDDPGRRPR